MKQFAGAALAALTVAGLALLALGHLGRWLAIGDTAAVGRLWVLAAAVVVLPGLWRVGRRGMAVIAGLAVLVSAGQTALAVRSAPAGQGALLLYQKNVLYSGGDRAALVADIRASRADIVTLQETVAADAAMFAALADDYPTQWHCRSNAIGDVAVLSRHPMVPGSAVCDQAHSWVTLRLAIADLGEVQVVSLHLSWPWPFSLPQQLPGVREAMAALPGPVIVAGDFNMQPWGASVSAVGRAAGVRRLGGYGSTYPGFGIWAPLIIDHVLIPQGWSGQAETRPLLGSDHLGLLARITGP